MAGRAADAMLAMAGQRKHVAAAASDDKDDELEFFDEREEAMFQSMGGEGEDEDDSMDEQAVMDIRDGESDDDDEGEDDEEEEEEEEEEDDDEGDEEQEPAPVKLKGYAAKLEKQAKLLRARPELREREEDEDEEDGEQGEDDDERGAMWGKKKRAYYSADTVDYELASEDEATPQEEEEEALRLQRQMEGALRPEDYEQDEEEEEEEEDEEDEGSSEQTMEERAKKSVAAAAAVAGGKRAAARAGAAGAGGAMELEQVARDARLLTEDDRLRAVLSETPELLSLLADLKASLSELHNKVTPLLEQVRAGKFSMTAKGLSYLEAKNALLLHYCCCLLFFLLLRAEGRPVRHHPVLHRLVELRLYLEKIRPIDKRLQYQIEKLLKAAAASSSDPQPKTKQEEDDELQFRPNPSQLVPKSLPNGDAADQAGGKSAAPYRPPKIAPVTMEDDEVDVDGRRKKDRVDGGLARRRRKGPASAFVKELAEELEGRPEEIEETGRVGHGSVSSAEMERELERLRARAAAEEEMFARVPMKRDERKRLRALRREQQRSSLSNLIDDFDEDVADIVEAEAVAAGRGGGGFGAEDIDGLGLLDGSGGVGRKRRLTESIAEAGRVSKAAAARGAGTALSGDMDLPVRPDLAERRRAYDSHAARRAAMDNEDSGGGMGGEEDDDDDGGSGDEFYNEVKAQKAAKAHEKQLKYSRGHSEGNIPAEEEEAEGKRNITYQMEKNRGLTPHRKKLTKNPRKKYKLKHAKAVVRRKGQVRQVRTGEAGAYGGESTGIKAGVSRSIRMAGM